MLLQKLSYYYCYKINKISVSLYFPSPRGQVSCFSVFRLCDRVALSHGGGTQCGHLAVESQVPSEVSFLDWLDFRVSFVLQGLRKIHRGQHSATSPDMTVTPRGQDMLGTTGRREAGGQVALVLTLSTGGLMAGHVGTPWPVGGSTQVDLMVRLAGHTFLAITAVISSSRETFCGDLWMSPSHTMGLSSESEPITWVYEVKCKSNCSFGAGHQDGGGGV